MSRRRSAYLFVLRVDIRLDDLKNRLVQMADRNRMNPSDSSPMGFIHLEDSPNELDYGYDDRRHVLFLEYGRYIMDSYTDFDGTLHRIPKPLRTKLVLDLETRVIYAYADTMSEAIRVVRILTSDFGEASVARVSYTSAFIRWLVEEGPERSRTLINVGKTKIEGISEVDAGTRMLVIDPTEQVRDSAIWDMVRSGDLTYSECTFRISDLFIRLLVYSIGKYTLMSTEQRDPSQLNEHLRQVYLELKRLYQEWEATASTRGGS